MSDETSFKKYEIIDFPQVAGNSLYVSQIAGEMAFAEIHIDFKAEAQLLYSFNDKENSHLYDPERFEDLKLFAMTLASNYLYKRMQEYKQTYKEFRKVFNQFRQESDGE